MQFWTHENHAIELFQPEMIDSRMTYIHENPVRAGSISFIKMNLKMLNNRYFAEKEIIMGAAQIRKLLHEYIDKADERFINLMYAMVQADMEEDNYELSASHKKILDERIAAHKANPSSGSSWEEVKSRIKSQL